MLTPSTSEYSSSSYSHQMVQLPHAPSAALSPWTTLSPETVHPSEYTALEEQWRDLSRAGHCAEPFFQPEWFQDYRTAIEPLSEALLLTVKTGERLTGVIPLARATTFFSKIPARTLRSLSNVHSCRFDFIHDRSNTEAVTKAAWEALRNDTSWDVIEALDVPVDGNFQALLEAARDDGFLIGSWATRKMPFLPLSSDPKNAFGPCPAAFKGSRQRLKSKLNKLAKEGAVEFAVYHEFSEERFKDFLGLEASGWKGQNGSAIAAHKELVSFYTSVARRASRNGTLRLYTMLLSGRPIAMHFGLSMNGTYYIPKVAYDEAHKKCSPGLLLMKHVLQDLTEQGIHRFDFLGPRMEWKCVWTSLYREHANCYIFRPTAKGRLLHAATMHIAAKIRAIKYRWKGDPQSGDWAPAE